MSAIMRRINCFIGAVFRRLLFYIEYDKMRHFLSERPEDIAYHRMRELGLTNF